MKILKIISCLLLICCSGFILGGCNKEEQPWIHEAQYYSYIDNYPEHKIKIEVQNVSYGYTNLTNCYNGNFNTQLRHIEFRIFLKNNAPSGWMGMLLHLSDINFNFKKNLQVYKIYMYLNKYTEDYSCFKINANNSYIIYVRILYKDLPYDKSLELEKDYILKLWDIRI